MTLAFNQADIDARFKAFAEGVTSFGDDADAIAQLLENSVRRNFAEGGRPTRWEPSKRAEAEDGQTLRDTNRLMNSIVGVGEDKQVKVGTNAEYAAAHNFGVNEIITQQVREHVRRISQAFGKPIEPKEVTVSAHSRLLPLSIPQREFMMIQDDDWEDIKDIITLRINRLMS